MNCCEICGKPGKKTVCEECSKRISKCPLCGGIVDTTPEHIPGSDGDHIAPVFTCRKCGVIIRFDGTQLSYEDCKRKFCYCRR